MAVPALTRVHFKGLAHTVALDGPIGPPQASAMFMIPIEWVAPDRYVISIEFEQIGHLKQFEVVVGLNGKLVVDPAFNQAIPLNPPGSLTGGITRLRFPADFQSNCFIALDCPQTDATDIADAKLWLGDTPLAIGAGPGVPAGGVRYYRARLAPGTYLIRVEHPHYRLPPTSPVVVNSTLVVRRFQLVTSSTNVTPLEIRGAAFFADKGQALVFKTNLPSEFQPSVQWASSNQDVLRHEGGGSFLAIAPGMAQVSARTEKPSPLYARTTATVRRSPDQITVRPVDPATVVVDSATGARVAAGELLVSFKPGTSAAQERAVITKLGLSNAGLIPGANLHHLTYDTSLHSLAAILKALDAESAVAVAAPNVMLQYSGVPTHWMIPAHKPTEVPTATTDLYWHLVNTEAFEAFGLLTSGIPRRRQTIVVMDSGVWVSNAGKLHIDLDGKIDLPRSIAIGSSDPVTGIQALKDPLEDPQSRVPHGNFIAGIAAARWDNGGAVGIDPEAQIVVVRQAPANEWKAATNFAAGLQYIADHVIDANTRVVVTSLSTNWFVDRMNDACVLPLEALLEKKDALFVIAAGNQDRPVMQEGLVSAKHKLSGEGYVRFMIVAGTEFDKAFNLGRIGPERRWRKAGIEPGSSNFGGTAPRLVDISAPARYVRGSDLNDTGDNHNGTSFAAPIVAGAASLLFSILPEKTPADDVRRILVESADCIRYADAPATPPVRLESEQDKYIGEGRINVWQAVLAALNTRDPKVQYVGLRVTADRGDLQLFVVDSAGAEERLTTDEKPVVLNNPSTFDATRMTLTNKQKPFPRFLRAKAFEHNEWTPVFEQRLGLNPGSIGELGCRPVLTRILFTNGAVLLQEIGERMPQHRAAISVENRVREAPKDADLRDPQSRRPGDKSLKPWMKLSANDSYVLKKTVTSGPPNLTLTWLDANLQPLPAQQVDEEQDPYVTVPFNGALRVHLDCKFPPGSGFEAADVLVVAFSLNNELKKESLLVKFRGEVTFPVLACAPGWLFQPSIGITLSGGGDLRVTTTCEPASWSGRAWIQNGPAPEGSGPPDGGWIVFTLYAQFSSPAQDNPGTVGTAHVIVQNGPPSFPPQRFKFQGGLTLPHVELDCANPESPYVVRVAGKNAVRATYAVKLRNASGFDVYVKGFEAHDALFPTYMPSDVPSVELKFGVVTPPLPPGEMLIGPGGTVDCEIRIHYHLNVVDLPPGAVGTRRVNVFLVDPRAVDASRRYPSQELTVRTGMHPKPEGT
jgi:subtilase family protein